MAELEVPTVPPPEWQFSAEPPSISALELWVEIKITQLIRGLLVYDNKVQ